MKPSYRTAQFTGCTDFSPTTYSKALVFIVVIIVVIIITVVVVVLTDEVSPGSAVVRWRRGGRGGLVEERETEGGRGGALVVGWTTAGAVPGANGLQHAAFAFLQHVLQSSLRAKHLQEVANELPGFLLPFLDEVNALLLHLLDKLFALLLYIANLPLHFVHTLLQVVLLLVNEADIEFLGCVSSLQVASDVYVVVSDNTRDDVRSGDALCPLGGSKHTSIFNVLVHIITAR